MKFAIRDDDICYFTKPRQLEKIYSKIWDKIPISLSIVPFQACTKSGALPKEYWQGNRIFPVDKNKELVEFLKEKIREEKVSIMLHGYSHKNYKEDYEFVAGTNLSQKVREGKRYLEELFETEIKTFVPPHNALSRKGMKAVIDNGLNLIGSFPFWVYKSSIHLPLIKRKIYQLKTGKRAPYPYILRFSDHLEMSHYTLTPGTDLKKLITAFNLVYHYQGIFCLAVHYWEFFHSEMEKMFSKFWKHINRFPNIEYTSVNKIFKDMA